jgi:hypothetical protein
MCSHDTQPTINCQCLKENRVVLSQNWFWSKIIHLSPVESYVPVDRRAAHIEPRIYNQQALCTVLSVITWPWLQWTRVLRQSVVTVVTALSCAAPFNGALYLLTRTKISCSCLIDLTGFDRKCLKRNISCGRLLKCSLRFSYRALCSGWDMQVAVRCVVSKFLFFCGGLKKLVLTVSVHKLPACLCD